MFWYSCQSFIVRGPRLGEIQTLGFELGRLDWSYLQSIPSRTLTFPFRESGSCIKPTAVSLRLSDSQRNSITRAERIASTLFALSGGR